MIVDSEGKNNVFFIRQVVPWVSNGSSYWGWQEDVATGSQFWCFSAKCGDLRYDFVKPQEMTYVDKTWVSKHWYEYASGVAIPQVSATTMTFALERINKSRKRQVRYKSLKSDIMIEEHRNHTKMTNLCKISGIKYVDGVVHLDDERLALADTLCWEDLTQMRFKTLMCYLVLCSDHSRLWISWIIGEARSFSDFTRMCKLLSAFIKQVHTATDIPSLELCECDTLSNRTHSDYSWSQDLYNRKKERAMQVVKLRPGAIVGAINDLFKGHIYDRDLKQDFKTYWATRAAGIPSGSSYEYKCRFGVNKAALKNQRKTKDQVLMTHKSLTHDTLLSYPKICVAKPSVKYEQGKNRAIYGCDMVNFLHADFALKGIEYTLPKIMPLGTNQSKVKTKEILSSIGTGITLCFDYEDFNSQHSTQSQQEVVDALLQHAREGRLKISDQQYLSLKWVRGALANQYVDVGDVHNLPEILEDYVTPWVRDNSKAYDTDSKRMFRVDGTLFSGHRYTTIINTILNAAYCQLILGKTVPRSRYHNGDDMIMSFNTYSDIFVFIARAKKLGVRAQKTKMLVGASREFLRIMQFRDEHAEYLARAVSSLVCGKQEAKVLFNLRSYVNSVYDRLNIINERATNKLDVIQTAKTLTKYHAKVLWNADENVIDEYFSTHPIQGGVKVDAPLKRTRLIDKVMTDNDDDRSRQHLQAIDPGIQDMLTYVCRQAGIVELNLIDRNLVRMSYLKHLSVNRVGMLVVQDSYPDLHDLLCIQGTLHKQAAKVQKYIRYRQITNELWVLTLHYPLVFKLYRDSYDVERCVSLATAKPVAPPDQVRLY